MKVLTCRVQGAVRNLSLVLALPLVCWAENTIEVISSDGTSTNAFSTAVDAFREVPTGGTVRLTADLTDQKTAEISKSCVFDLNGHDLSFAKDQDCLKLVSPNVTLSVFGNGYLSGHGSMFSIQEANCVVDVSDTEINESRNIMYCLKDKSRANLRNGTVVVTDQMVSKWGASASKLYLFDGATAYFSKVDDDANRANAGIVLEGGSLSLNLTNHVAEGRCLLYDRRQITTRKLGTVTTWYRVVDETEAFAPGTPYEVVADRICYSTLGNAVALVPNGANLRLLKDVNLGDSRLTLARDKDMHHTFDLGGHTVSGNDGFFAPLGNVVISNGTFKVAQGGTKTVIYLTQNDSHVYFAPSVTIDASIDSTCLAFVYDGKNSTFICDGCTILGKLYSVWNTGNIATSRLILTNDVTFAGSPIGHRERTDTTVRFYGGAYSSNPSAFLGENCAIYHTNTISTLPYFVTPFARQTFNFDKPLEERIFTSKPSGAVQVELVFTGAYDRKKSYRLADFSAVDGFENLTFSLAEDSHRPRMSLSYNNGKLTSHPLGMTLIFR